MSSEAPDTGDLLDIYATEAESAVLGGVLIDGNAMDDNDLDRIPVAAFSPGHGVIWDAMVRLHRRDMPTDLVTVTEALRQGGKLDRVGGVTTLLGLANTPGTTALIRSYADQVTSAYRRRLVATAGLQAASRAKSGADPDKVVADLEADLYRISRKHGGTDLEDAVESAKRYATSTARLSTGLAELDRVCIGGLPIGDLTVMAGRTSMGKSALAHQIAFSVGNAHVLSPDQPLPEILANEACRRSGIPLEVVQLQAWRKPTDRKDWLNALEAVKGDVGTKVAIDDGSLNLGRMVVEARRAAMRGRKLIVVDHVQRVSGDRGYNSRRELMVDVTSSLKDIARDFGVSVLALSQLSRDTDRDGNHRPMLSHLSESKSLEEDSNMVLFIYREKYYDPATPLGDVAEVIVAKNKGGPRNRVARLVFEERFVRFKDPLGMR